MSEAVGEPLVATSEEPGLRLCWEHESDLSTSLHRRDKIIDNSGRPIAAVSVEENQYGNQKE